MGNTRRRTYSACSDVSEHFYEINEREVEDITLEFFYKPHTISVLTLCVFALVYSAFTRLSWMIISACTAAVKTTLLHHYLIPCRVYDSEAMISFTGRRVLVVFSRLCRNRRLLLVCSMFLSTLRDDTSVEDNLWKGMLCVIFLFLTISGLAFPNGPFTRPHPLMWRSIFGMSVLYFIILAFIVFQDYKTVRLLIGWLCPDMKNFSLVLPEYAQDCNNVPLHRLYSHIDVYMFGHYVGWIMKALLIRHYGLCWAISITWELTELSFLHLLPNFAECWWDAVILDIFFCNALGIHTGMWISKKMEFRSYHWESVKDIQSTTGKIRRCVLQFTPETWTVNKWLDPNSSFMRVVGVAILVIMFQLSELNTFFLKHIFEVPTNHRLTMGRLIFIVLISAPAIRQYYSYVTDTQCTRLGTQAWVYIAVNLTELVVCMKFGYEMFKHTQLILIINWFLVLILSSFIAVYICAMVVKHPLNKSSRSEEQQSSQVPNQDRDSVDDSNYSPHNGKASSQINQSVTAAYRRYNLRTTTTNLKT